ncbi:MAG: hypothetical protein ACRDRP_21025 [Pseudonocardiaceae bacterium]
MQDDLDLWRNIVREYSEELLGDLSMTAAADNRWTTSAGRFTAPCNAPVKPGSRGPMFWALCCMRSG